jgi:dephospho-CoA kinase
MARQLRIGLTGGIASGKSTVAQHFQELGVSVIDADDSARSVVAPGQPGLVAVIKEFGPAFLTASGDLDRRALRECIFSDLPARRRLEGILHPLIRADMERRAQDDPGSYIVLAIPLLIESSEPGRVDRVLVVDLPEDIQLERVIARDRVSSDQARAIISAQASRESRLAAADDVLVNDGSVSMLRKAVDSLHLKYMGLSAARAGAFRE